MRKVKIRCTFFLLLSILFCLAGCSPQERSDLDIILINNSNHSLINLAWERDASNLVDPIDSLVVAKHDGRLVMAGESAQVKDIEGGYSKGDDIRFFLYRTISIKDEKAPLGRILDVTNEELEGQNYQVIINDWGDLDCDNLQAGIINMDSDIVKFEINKLVTDLEPVITDSDNIGHKENLCLLIERLNAQCDNIRAELICYACILTGILQSEILVTTNSAGTTIYRTVDISTPDDDILNCVRIHEYINIMMNKKCPTTNRKNDR